MFFPSHTSERDPQDQVIHAGGGGVFVFFFEICIAPLMTTIMRVTLSDVSAGSCGSVYERCGVASPSTELT